VISGTVAKETTPETRAKGFSIFYAMVNLYSIGRYLESEPCTDET
jgi:hypothetical protein